MPAIAQILANRRNAQKSTSTRFLQMSLVNPADCFMQNKANLLNAQMNITKVSTKDYGNFRLCGPRENKANSKPIKANLSLPKGEQTQFLYQYAQNKPNFYTNMRKTNPISIPNMQNKAKQTQFQKGHLYCRGPAAGAISG